MSLAISSRIVSGVIVVDIVGRLCFLNVTLRDRVNEWLQEGHRAFVFNLANVPYADSFGLGQLITISNSVRSKGGQLILLGQTDHVRALFQIQSLIRSLTFLRMKLMPSEACEQRLLNLFPTPFRQSHTCRKALSAALRTAVQG